MAFQRHTVNYERFPSEYFSGGDVHIYFGDTFVDEITYLDFTLQESVFPIFGYNSFVFDDFVRGSRIIQGAFRINFKDVNYLKGLMDHILTGNTEMLKQDLQIRDRKPTEEDVNKLLKYAEEGWSREFDVLSQKFEDAIWRTSEPVNKLRKQKTTFFPNTKEGFNIRITYGPYNQTGYENEEINYYNRVNKGTVRALYGVQLHTVKQIHDLSGQPIQEEYLFYAKDLDRENF